MTPRNAAELAFGVAGIYYVAEYIPSIFSSVAAMFQDEHARLVWVGIAHVVLALVVGSALVRFRGQLAARLTQNMDAAPPQAGAPGAHAAAISVVGIYYLVPGLSSIISLTAARLTDVRFASENADFIRYGLQTVLGAGLFLGAPGIVRAWTALRTAGRHDGDAA
jgi:hypothetical protein